MGCKTMMARPLHVGCELIIGNQPTKSLEDWQPKLATKAKGNWNGGAKSLRVGKPYPHVSTHLEYLFPATLCPTVVFSHNLPQGEEAVSEQAEMLSPGSRVHPVDGSLDCFHMLGLDDE